MSYIAFHTYCKIFSWFSASQRLIDFNQEMKNKNKDGYQKKRALEEIFNLKVLYNIVTKKYLPKHYFPKNHFFKRDKDSKEKGLF